MMPAIGASFWAFAYAIQHLARAYTSKPATSTDEYLARIDENLRAGISVHVPHTLDWIDTVVAVERAEDEARFVADIEAWLSARARYEQLEGGSS